MNIVDICLRSVNADSITFSIKLMNNLPCLLESREQQRKERL